MATALIVKEDRLIYAAEVPEEPKKWDYEAGGNEQGAYVHPEYYDALEIYEAALASAKESAVLCDNQTQAFHLLWDLQVTEFGVPELEWKPKPGTYPIPDLQWEVKEEVIGVANVTPFRSVTEFRKVAILKESTSSTEQESQDVSYNEYLEAVGADDNNTYARKIYERLIHNGFTITRKP